MDFDDTDSNSDGREKWLTGVRLFKDQIESLKWLAVHKYRNNRTSADLIREAVDQFIDREKSRL
jgi:predicted DNA-binding protein